MATVKKLKNEAKQIYKLIGLFPRHISVNVRKSGRGFFADIKSFPGCMTQADSFSELIDMVNDAIRTYFEVPDKYLPFMPSYRPPISEATRLNVFPGNDKKEIQLEIQDGAAAKC